MPLPRLATALVLVSALGPGRALAAPAPADTLHHEIAPQIVSAARPATTPGGASALEVLLDSTLVRPAATLEEVLRKIPLVIIRRNSRGEAQPAARGGEDRQIAVLVDGVPITLAWDQRTDLSIVPVTAARTITMHRGLSTLLAGPNALAGTLEVDIARGTRADAAPPPLVLDVGVDQTGAKGVGLLGGLMRGGSTGHWLARAGVGLRRSDGAALPHALADGDPATAARLTSDGDLRLNSDSESMDGFLSLRRVGRDGAWASFTGMGAHYERGVAPEAHTNEPRLWRYPRQDRGLGTLALGTGMRPTAWGRGDLELGVGLDAGSTRIDEYADLTYQEVTGTERADDRTLTARLLGDHTLGSDGDLRMAATYADITHDETIDLDPEAHYRQRLWSIATETDWRVASSNPLRLSAGVALDGADTPESADKPPLEPLDEWAARLGATVVLRDGAVLVHASGGRRARFPGLRELYSGALGRFLENPGLAPEVLRTVELGSTWRSARSELQLVVFVQALEDAISRITVETPEGNKFQRVNLGMVDARGVELVGNFAGRAFSGGGSMTLQHVRGEDASGNETELEYEPAISGSVWGEAPLPGRLWLTAELAVVGAQHYIDLDSGAFADLASGARIDLRVARGFDLRSAGPWHRIDAQLAVENIADLPVYDQAGLPQPGRTIRLQVRFW